MAEYRELLKRVAQALEAAELSYVIVGGFAINIRSRPRTTMDLDLIIEDDPFKISMLLEVLKNLHFDVMESQTQSALAEGTNASIFDESSPLRIDLKVARKPDDLLALDNGQWEDTEGLRLRIASAELILFGKVVYLGNIRDIPDSELLEYNDVRDFVNLYQHTKNVDIDMVRE